MPTYDLTLARYNSKYVTFTHRAVQAKKNGPHLRLSASDQALFNKILHMPTYTMAGNRPQQPGVASSGPLNTVLDLPALAIGRYGVNGSGMRIRCSAKSRKAQFDEIRQLVVQPAAGDSGRHRDSFDGGSTPASPRIVIRADGSRA
jgi:hypothetical protein